MLELVFFGTLGAGLVGLLWVAGRMKRRKS